MKFSNLHMMENFIPKTIENKNPNKNNYMCILYSVSSNIDYIRALELSLRSLHEFTDVNLDNVFIITTEDFYDRTKNKVGYIIEDKNFIRVPSGACPKVVCFEHKRVRDYQKKIVIDADMFFYSRNKVDMFDIINNLWKENDTVISFHEYDEFYLTLKKRAQQTSFTGLLSDNHKYIEMFLYPDIPEKRLSEPWPNSSFYAFSNKFNEDGFFKHLLDSVLYKVTCDETVWNSWAFKNNYNFIDLKKIEGFDLIGSHNFGEVFDKIDIEDGNLWFIHMLSNEAGSLAKPYDIINYIILRINGTYIIREDEFKDVETFKKERMETVDMNINFYDRVSEDKILIYWNKEKQEITEKVNYKQNGPVEQFEVDDPCDINFPKLTISNVVISYYTFDNIQKKLTKNTNYTLLRNGIIDFDRFYENCIHLIMLFKTKKENLELIDFMRNYAINKEKNEISSEVKLLLKEFRTESKQIDEENSNFFLQRKKILSIAKSLEDKIIGML